MIRTVTGLFLIMVASLPAGTPSFEIDVEAVLAKAGCNAGACHGNQNGKGGFRLSLRGQDPNFDYQSLIHQYGGRRINRLEPAKSLLLQKASMEIPHQGGLRFQRESPFYAALRDWIADGATPPRAGDAVTKLVVTPASKICFAPDAEVQLSVAAVYADGSRRDVTDTAVYESSTLGISISDSGLVRRSALGESTVVVRYLNQQVPVQIAFLPAQEDFAWTAAPPRNYVDEQIFAKLRDFRSNPTQQCSDHVFLRRAFLDLLGILPSRDEARAFATDDDPGKRAALIDALLARPEFADHWAQKWADLLRVEEKVLDPKGVEIFYAWIRDSIAAGKPLDRFVAELLVARGSTYENPPTNYFRALRAANQRGEAAARVFLGTRLQCAQCHNHPFDRWTQDDYYAWAALFARVDYQIIENTPDDKLDKNQFKGEQVVLVSSTGEVENPTTGQTMLPRFLGESSAIDGGAARLEELASWLTSTENHQFARAQANRLWYHLMGKGLVEPVDDFRVTNPASHPALLEALADDLIAHDFDIRHLLRVIMNSATYQLAAGDDAAAENYAATAVRRLTAEQLLDSQARVLDTAIEFNGHVAGLRAGQLPGIHKVRFRSQPPSAGDRFLFAFGKPERLMTCECERSDATTLSQALLLVNGECMDQLLTSDQNVLNKMLRRGDAVAAMIEDLYWAALSRVPTEQERHQTHSTLARGANLRAGLEDVTWALLNAKEFVFRQ